MSKKRDKLASRRWSSCNVARYRRQVLALADIDRISVRLYPAYCLLIAPSFEQKEQHSSSVPLAVFRSQEMIIQFGMGRRDGCR
jgi:hypothetical protein